MSRPDVPESSRRDFYLYIDEFHNFSTESFASILSEARKYRLCLTLAHQYIDQLSDTTRDAVFGNAGSLLSFRVGEADAAVLARQLGEYPASALTSLANYEVCAKLLNGGQSGQSFLGRTLPPSGMRQGRRENIVRRSRQRYATTRRVVEEKLKRWMTVDNGCTSRARSN